MKELLFLAWYVMAILPMFIFVEATAKLSKFLKERDIYDGWDKWHSLLVILIILAMVLYSAGVK